MNEEIQAEAYRRELAAANGSTAEALQRLLMNRMILDYRVSPLMWEWGTNYEVDSLRKFNDVAERAISNEALNFENYIRNSAQGVDASALDDFSHSDEFQRITIEFGQVHRSSIFLRSYALLERILNYVCEDFADWNQEKLKVKDLHGSGIERAKNYLTKLHDFDFVSKNQYWDLLLQYGKIRNLYAHTYGDLPDDEQKRTQIKKDIKILKSVTAKDGGIVLEVDFVKEFLTVLSNFFESFFRKIEEYTQSNPAKPKQPRMLDR